MRICGFAAEGLRSERRIYESFPVKELQDYWASRPRYEDIKPKLHDTPSGEASGSGIDGQPYQEWLATQKEANEDAPPPPYSLEAEEVPVERPQPSSSRPGTSPPVQLLISETLNVAGSSYKPGTTRFEGPQPARMAVHSASQVPESYSPPSINMSTRPQQPQMTSPAVTVTTPQSLQPSPHHPALSQDPISSLEGSFGKIAMTMQAQEPLKNPPLPPPLHPAHSTPSGRVYGKRPQTAQSSFPPRPQSQTRPGSQSGVTPQASSSTNGRFSPGQGSQRPQQLPDGVSTSNPWGPAPQHQVPPTGQSTYPGQYSGAQLSRPYTFSATSSSQSSPSLRPHGPVSQGSPAVSPAPYRPSTTGQSFGPGAFPFPGAGLSSDSPDTLPNPAAPLFPSGPSQYLYPSAGSSPYPESHGSLPSPVQASYTTQGHGSSGPPHTLNPTSSASSFPSGSYRPGQSTPQVFPLSQGPTYSGQPYGDPVPSASPPPPASHGNPQGGYFPNIGSSQGEALHFPQAHTSQFPTPQGYPQSYPDLSSYDNQQSTPYGSASSPGWFPGSSNNPVPPPMPPRE